MDGTPSTPEKEYGQKSCGGICYIYVEHMGGSHPMYIDAYSCTCVGYEQSSDLLPLFVHLFGDER
jgi:hypothetical protein